MPFLIYHFSCKNYFLFELLHYSTLKILTSIYLRFILEPFYFATFILMSSFAKVLKFLYSITSITTHTFFLQIYTDGKYN